MTSWITKGEEVRSKTVNGCVAVDFSLDYSVISFSQGENLLGGSLFPPHTPIGLPEIIEASDHADTKESLTTEQLARRKVSVRSICPSPLPPITARQTKASNLDNNNAPRPTYRIRWRRRWRRPSLPGRSRRWYWSWPPRSFCTALFCHRRLRTFATGTAPSSTATTATATTAITSTAIASTAATKRTQKALPAGFRRVCSIQTPSRPATATIDDQI